jgi:uncharacterized protein
MTNIETDTMAARDEVRFASGGNTCAAWHYPGTNGACVIMAGAFAVTRWPGTDRFAQRFNAAGYAPPRQPIPGLATGGRRPIGAARPVLPARS